MCCLAKISELMPDVMKMANKHYDYSIEWGYTGERCIYAINYHGCGQLDQKYLEICTTFIELFLTTFAFHSHILTLKSCLNVETVLEMFKFIEVKVKQLYRNLCCLLNIDVYFISDCEFTILHL